MRDMGNGVGSDGTGIGELGRSRESVVERVEVDVGRANVC